MAVASLSHDNQRHLKAMQFVVQFLDNSEAYFDAEVHKCDCIHISSCILRQLFRIGTVDVLRACDACADMRTAYSV